MYPPPLSLTPLSSAAYLTYPGKTSRSQLTSAIQPSDFLSILSKEQGNVAQDNQNRRDLRLRTSSSLFAPLSSNSSRILQVCAWCYVGHIELEQGIALAKARGLPVSFSVRYHPLFLNNNLPEDAPIQKEEYFAKKFPNADDGAKILSMLVKRGKEEGVAL